MINTLFLPELREMLAEGNAGDLREFCTALHPARTAEFMEGLESHEAWQVLQFAEPALRAEIFYHLDADRQLQMLSTEEDREVAELVARISADDATSSLSAILLDDDCFEFILRGRVVIDLDGGDGPLEEDTAVLGHGRRSPRVGSAPIIWDQRKV